MPMNELTRNSRPDMFVLHIAGEFRLSWENCDVMNDPAPSGVCFYRLTQGARQQSRKLLPLR